MSEKLEAGTIFVNTYNKTDVAVPFGGFKQSGFGKDLGNILVYYEQHLCMLNYLEHIFEYMNMFDH